MPVQTLIQVRQDTAANWTTADSVLSSGEFGFESDTQQLKIGDGSTAWTSLGYITDTGLLQDVLDLISLTGVPGNSTALTGYTAGAGTVAATDNILQALQKLDGNIQALSATGATSVVADITARNALTPSTGDIAFVTDASADATVGSGAATYVWDGSAWVKISEAEGIDFTLTAADITNVASGNLVATDVQAALNELQTDVDTRAVDSTVVHLAGAESITGIKTFTAQPSGIAASSIVNTPAGNIAATTAQAAIDELDSEKQADVVTTRGDVIRGSSAGAAERLALGSNGTFLKSDGTDAAWSNVINGGTA